MTNEQIDYFGKETAKIYIEEGVDLNSTITKIAEEHALNRYEIDRIVEAANTSTYLSMFSNLDDKYIEFPVANAEKVAEYLSPSTDVDSFSDYNEPPEKDHAEIPIFPVESVEKISSVQDENQFSADNLRFRQRAKYAERQLIDKISLAENAFSEETENLYQLVKQAVLTGIRFGHIKTAMEQHSPGIFTEKFSELAKEKLKKEDRRLDLSDTKEKLGTVNKNNEILQQINKLAIIYNEAIDYNEKLASLATQIVKRLGTGLTSTVRGALRFGTKFPKITMFGGVLGTAGATGLAYKAGKTKAEYETSAIRTIPESYRKR